MPCMLAHVKPSFMLDLLDRLEPQGTVVWYADPDLVIDAPWALFERKADLDYRVDYGRLFFEPH